MPVSSKTQRPRVDGNAISRPGPIELLNQVPNHRVTIVTAPAGFGKSWLVSDWLDWHSDWHQSWITVDAYDRDPMRLWLRIVESVQATAEHDAGENARTLLASGRSGIPLIVDTLTADLARRTAPTIIVFDDSHRLDGDESVASIDQFLTELPDNTHAILVGRHDPTVPLSKMRISDDLLEIRTADLRCTLAETQTLINESLRLALPPEAVASLHTKTMGWMAGVRLASESISRSRDMSRSASELPDVATLEGAYDALGDYLLEEVLDELDEEDRQFLLDTSILHDLSGPLCDAVSERSDSAEMLERLARSAMFTSRIGEADGWYRYHDFFRDAMTGILRRTAPDRHVEVHHRAAMWFREHGDTVEAVDHVLRAGEPDLASQWLVESCQEMLLGQQYETMRTLFARVDEASDSLSPITLLAWCYPVVYD
ncbi:MAG: AAA family ATPase, partial [Acidimicrobiia bacterium]